MPTYFQIYNISNTDTISMENRRYFDNDITTYKEAVTRIQSYTLHNKFTSSGGEFLVHSIENDVSFLSKSNNYRPKLTSSQVNLSGQINSNSSASHSHASTQLALARYAISVKISNFPIIPTFQTSINNKIPELKFFNPHYNSLNYCLNEKDNSTGQFIPIIHIPIFQETHKDADGNLIYMYFLKSIHTHEKSSEPTWENIHELIDYYKIGGNGEKYLKYFLANPDFSIFDKDWLKKNKLPEIKLSHDIYNTHEHELKPYFHPEISARDFENLILSKTVKNGAFLLRNSSKDIRSYSLAVKHVSSSGIERPVHIRIMRHVVHENLPNGDKIRKIKWSMSNQHGADKYDSITAILENEINNWAGVKEKKVYRL